MTSDVQQKAERLAEAIHERHPGYELYVCQKFIEFGDEMNGNNPFYPSPLFMAVNIDALHETRRIVESRGWEQKPVLYNAPWWAGISVTKEPE